jgi:hypothetical protein
MINILFSTTRQWNPGDEFILQGIRRILGNIGAEYNNVIYNRHPSITPRRTTLRHRWSSPHLVPHFDNSFILDQPGTIDYVIFAGTPEWYGGKRMDDLHQYIAENNVRCAFLGVGVPKAPVFSDTLKHILKNLTDVVIARDPNCYEAVKQFGNAHFLPCPALFSAPGNQHRTKLNNLGIVIQDTATTNHSIPGELSGKLEAEFKKLESLYKVTYIAHYIDDLKYAVREKKPVLYSAFSEDFHSIFNKFDFVISTRVHGCGMASSLGIPNILIPHDGRYSTAEKFLSAIYDPSVSLTRQVQSVNVEAKSSELIAHRSKSENEYYDLLNSTLTFLKNKN